MGNKCTNYCGDACINGVSCPIVLSDDYEDYGCDVKVSCSDCFYNLGCDYCIFSGTFMCDCFENPDA